MRNAVSNRHDNLRSLLDQLHLGSMAATFAELAMKAAKEGLSHEAYLYELTVQEVERRGQWRVERLLRQSGLPREKTFRTLEVERFPPALRHETRPLEKRSLPRASNKRGSRWEAWSWEKSRSGCRWAGTGATRPGGTVDEHGQSHATFVGRQTRFAAPPGIAQAGSLCLRVPR